MKRSKPDSFDRLGLCTENNQGSAVQKQCLLDD